MKYQLVAGPAGSATKVTFNGKDVPEFTVDKKPFRYDLYRIAFNVAMTQRRRRRPTVSLDHAKETSNMDPPDDDDDGEAPAAGGESEESADDE